MKIEAKQVVAQELENILKSKGGKLIKAADVVRYAQSHKTSAIAKEMFAVDDKQAIIRYRLSQARVIIREWVEYEPRLRENVRVVVSLATDRTAGMGYRSRKQVMSDPQFTSQIVEQALNDVAGRRESYSYIDELVPFFDRLDQLINQFKAEIRQGDAQAG